MKSVHVFLLSLSVFVLSNLLAYQSFKGVMFDCDGIASFSDVISADTKTIGDSLVYKPLAIATYPAGYVSYLNKCVF